jgi:hypothetical protein
MSIEPLREKWLAFGWDVIEIDGHDILSVTDALYQARVKPRETDRHHRHNAVKGRGWIWQSSTTNGIPTRRTPPLPIKCCVSYPPL